METLLRKIAWISWSNEGGAVPVDSVGGWPAVDAAIAAGVLVRDEAGVKFADLKDMVAAAAEYVLHQEQGTFAASPKTCFERLHTLWANEIGNDLTVSGQVLAALHNSRKFDAFAWAREAVEAGVGIFDVLYALEKAVPFFEHAQADTIFRFLAESYDKEKNDIFGGRLYLKLEQWLPRHPDIARELMRLQELQPQERGCGLYGAALHALILHDFANGVEVAVNATQSPERWIAGPAINVLGIVDYAIAERAPAISKTIEILAAIIDDSQHPLLSTAVTAAGRLLHLNEEKLAALLQQAASTHKPEALYALAGFVALKHNQYGDQRWFWPLVMHLTHAQAPHKGTLDNVDHVLYGWLKNPARVPKVIEFLNAWIANQSSQALHDPGLVKVFDSTVHRLAETPAALSVLITGWLLHPDDRYPMVAHSVVSKLRIARVTTFSLDSTTLDGLSAEELVFLVRRILGHLFGHDIILPLVFSLLDTRDAKTRTFGLVAGVVRDRLGYDYPEETLAFLKEKEQTTSDLIVKELCSVLVSEIEGRDAAERALPLLKEFYPSPEKVRRFSKERHRQMTEAMEKANGESVFRQIVTEIPLKAGHRTFSKFQGKYSAVSGLKGISHSIPIPRTEIADPMGSARERYLFRRSKKGDT